MHCQKHKQPQQKLLRLYKVAPQVGLEPTTTRLTAECSAIELLRNDDSENLLTLRITFNGIRRRPTLPGRFQPSTISAERLNFCVRYGNRWDPLAITTGNCISFSLCFPHLYNCTVRVDLNTTSRLPLPEYFFRLRVLPLPSASKLHD